MITVECKKCGFDQNDIILSNCLICNQSLPVSGLHNLSDEDIILSTGEWVGRVGDSSFQTTKDFNIWKTAFLKNKYLGLKIGGVDKGVIEMSKEKIEEVANIYLTVLENRAIVKPELYPVFLSLKSELDNKKKSIINKLGGQKKVMTILLILFVLLLFFGPFIMIFKLLF